MRNELKKDKQNTISETYQRYHKTGLHLNIHIIMVQSQKIKNIISNIKNILSHTELLNERAEINHSYPCIGAQFSAILFN